MLRRGLVAVNPLFGSLGEHISAHNFFNKKLIVEIMCLYNFYMNKFFFCATLQILGFHISIVSSTTSKRSYKEYGTSGSRVV
jgi:hypothetical protein